MNRKEMGFLGAVTGACLVAAGVMAFTPAWVFLVGGGLVGLAGLAALGARGALPLLATGVWLAASVAIPWAHAPWNLLVAGLLAIALGYASGSMGSLGVVYEEDEAA